ncbi:Aste57867_20781 [Aphanomyces stellatus]|uniref:RING finger protein 141 n=1 Tax=Aphanomyces stellatus TaxID=120398 RepID=A0A485LFX8_9STRA|nr:hypothetical protein As57867_020713 [Aphanomyces stellatus]VFT97460.1 Aste57867_20781 [Aphanomyces stellatus]
MQVRARASMGAYVDLGKHLDQANEWAKLCPTPKTCQLRFRIVLNERIAPELIPFMWKLEGNVMIEARKVRRGHPPDDSDTYVSNNTIGAAKSLTLDQFYYIYCFLSDVNDCAMHSVALNPVFGSDKEKDFDDRECQICMDKEKEVVLPCTHSFCLRCFQTWSAQNQTCPICRSQLHCAEGEELWHLSSSRGISNITSYAQDLVSRIYEFLDKQPVSRFTEAHVLQSRAHYSVWRLETIQSRLEQPQDTTPLVDVPMAVPVPDDTLHPDYIFALALAGGEDQELALEECRRQMHFPTLSYSTRVD